MQVNELIFKYVEHSQRYLTEALDGLTQEEAAWKPGAESNSIIFILWHIARVEDYFVNRVIQRKQELYEVEGWRENLGTPASNSGYQYTVEQLGTWPVPQLEVLRGYATSVREKTLAYIDSVTPEKLSEAARPERSSDSIDAILARAFAHIMFHVGQIAYLRGMQRGLNR